jgi:viroplasmin and RNaseH domain-containing protein
MFTEKAANYINSIDSADERYQFCKNLTKAANRFAVKYGHRKATLIDIRKDGKDDLIESTPFGWVKDSTGEYVPNSYVNKCFGKGVHYKHAVCKVRIGLRDLWMKY